MYHCIPSTNLPVPLEGRASPHSTVDGGPEKQEKANGELAGEGFCDCWIRRRVPGEQRQSCDREGDGEERGRMPISGVKVSNAMVTASNDEGMRGCSVALAIELTAYISNGWNKSSG